MRSTRPMCPRIIATATQIGLSIRSSRRFSAYSMNATTATGTKYVCKAIVNDISINAPNRQNVTYTIQMQMNSKPVKTVAD